MKPTVPILGRLARCSLGKRMIPSWAAEISASVGIDSHEGSDWRVDHHSNDFFFVPCR